MSDPAVERALAVKQFADRLERDVAAELSRFGDARRSIAKMQEALRSLSRGLIALFEKAGKERTEQKASILLLERYNSPSSGSSVVPPFPAGHILMHSTERWIPVIPASKDWPVPVEHEREPDHLSVPEPQHSELWELLAETEENPWAQPVAEEPADQAARSSSHKQADTNQATQRMRDAG